MFMAAVVDVIHNLCLLIATCQTSCVVTFVFIIMCHFQPMPLRRNLVIIQYASAFKITYCC